MLHKIWSDAYVIKRVLRGHANDFEHLVKRYGRSVHAVSLAQTGNYADAEDIAQQAFIKAYQSLDTLKEPAKFGAWICTIARNLSFSQLRKRRDDLSVEEISEGALPSSMPDPASDELRELLRSEIEGLEPQACEVLLLYYFGEQRIARVAQLLEISNEAAKKRLQRARAALSQRLEGRIHDLFDDADTNKRNRAIMTGIAATTPAWKPATTAALITKTTTLAAVTILAAASIVAYRTSQPETLAPGNLDDATPIAPQSINNNPTTTETRLANDSTTSDSTETAASVTSEPETTRNEILPFDVVAGAVTDEDGTPISGATVWANKAHYAAPRTSIETQTDDNGTFTLNLTEGRWVVKVRKGNLFGTPAQHTQGYIRLSEDRTSTIHEITLRPAGKLTGRLLDETTDEPIPNAKLWLDQGVQLTTDQTGTFHYEGIPQGDHVITAVTPGYERRRYLYDNSLDLDAHIVLRTRPGGAIHGRVIDEAGNPVRNASVGNSSSGSTLTLQSRFEQTGPDGAFVRDGVAYGAPYRMSAMAEGYEESPDQWTTVYEGIDPDPMLFVLKRESDIPEVQAPPGEIPHRLLAGTITDEEGNPIANVDVRWRSTDLYTGSDATTTNEDGAFEIPNAQDREGYLSAAIGTHLPLIEPVETGTWNNLHLTMRPGETIHGKVVNAQGEPIQGATIIRRRDQRGQKIMWYSNPRTYTDEDGEFELKGYDPAELTVDILKTGYSEIRKHTLDPDAESNVISMKSGGTLVGKVLLPDGTPAPEFAMLVMNTRKSQRSGSIYAGYQNIGVHFANSDGRFVITGIDADKDFQLVATAHGYGDAILDPVRTTTLDKAASVEGVTLQLSAAPSFDLRIALDDDPDTPVPGVHGVLLDNKYRQSFGFPWDEISWNRAIRRASDIDGVIHYDAVPFTEGTLLIRAPGFARQVFGWNNQLETFEILLQPESHVHGIITNAQGAPITDGRCTLTRKYDDTTKQTLSFMQEFTPDAPGRVHFTELPAGQYSIQATAGESNALYTEFTLGVGEILDINDIP